VGDGGVTHQALHDLLAGRSDRLLKTEPPPLDAVRALAREGDIEAARDFYRLAPLRLRALRLRHGIAPGPVNAARVRQCLIDEISEIIGEFHVPGPDHLAPIVGRRRAAQMRTHGGRRDDP
jgi:hypothetical protein